jgi:hypothetical protein
MTGPGPIWRRPAENNGRTRAATSPSCQYSPLEMLWGLSQFSLVRAELQTARQLGEQLLTLAQSVQDPMGLLAPLNGLGTTLTHLGDFLPARAYLEQSMALYEPHMHEACGCWYGIDLGVDSRAHLAHVLWLLGYPEQARRRAHEAFTLA